MKTSKFLLTKYHSDDKLLFAKCSYPKDFPREEWESDILRYLEEVKRYNLKAALIDMVDQEMAFTQHHLQFCAKHILSVYHEQGIERMAYLTDDNFLLHLINEGYQRAIATGFPDLEAALFSNKEQALSWLKGNEIEHIQPLKQ